MSKALAALYEGDLDKALALLGPDDELTVFEAAAFGRVDRLKELLRTDPPSATALSDDGFSALHLAIFGRQEPAVRVLIEHGADLNQLSTGAIAQVPPLGTAAFVRSVPLARVLLDAGANVNGQGAGGFTALHAAAHNGDAELARELLSRGADPASEDSHGRTPADLASGDELRQLLA